MERFVYLETTQVQTDLERWLTDTYALWSENVGGSWKLIGGYEKNWSNMKMLREILERDWGITNREEGLRQVQLLTQERDHHNPESDAWDYCRATQLLGLFYEVGYISRDELIGVSCMVGGVMQRQYRSWEQLISAYLRGFEQWCRQNFSPKEAQERLAGRRALYERLRGMPNGPFRQPWDLPLVPPARRNPAGCYQDWVSREEGWMRDSHRRIIKRVLVTVALPTIVFLALFLGAAMLVSPIDGSPAEHMAAGAVLGVIVGIIITGIYLLTLKMLLLRNHPTVTIGEAVKALNLDPAEQDLLGSEMLVELQDLHHTLTFWGRSNDSQKIPARLMVSEHFLYWINGVSQVVLVRRSDVQYVDTTPEEGKNLDQKARAAQTRLSAISFSFYPGAAQRMDPSMQGGTRMLFYRKDVREGALALICGGTQHQ